MTSANLLNPEKYDSRLLLVGHKGYLGQNISSHLSKLGITFGYFDTRKENINDLELAENSIVIDCSRINSLDPLEISRDISLHRELVGYISRSNARYIRIASTLEFVSEEVRNPYVMWSSSRSLNVELFGKSEKNQILFVPNIYGGINSKSVVDVLLSGYFMRKKVALVKPHNFCDFLGIDVFIHEVMNIVLEQPSEASMKLAITSGSKYHIGSLQDYMYSEIDSPISVMNLEFGDIQRIGYHPDLLVKYIDTYCTL